MVTANIEVDLLLKIYHEYKTIWAPKVGEILSTEWDSGNSVDKYVACV